MCINPIVKGSAASIINKVGDYALSGLPVINTQESPEYRTLIQNYQCGINCECGNAQQVAEAIVKLASDKELRIKMGEGSRRLAKEKFDRRNTYLKIIEALESL
jgi:glycosyltransferase involved in cell wall biosynthesis